MQSAPPSTSLKLEPCSGTACLLVTSSCFLVTVFLEGYLKPALSPEIPAPFSHNMAQVLCQDLAEGNMLLVLLGRGS